MSDAPKSRQKRVYLKQKGSTFFDHLCYIHGLLDECALILDY